MWEAKASRPLLCQVSAAVVSLCTVLLLGKWSAECAIPGGITCASDGRATASIPAFPGWYGKQSVLTLARYREELYPKMVPLLLPETNDSQAGHSRFEALTRPAVQCPVTRRRMRYGNAADGGKELCDLGVLRAPCVIYSLGSNGDYSFEKSVLAASKCDVHTFDCTYAGVSIDNKRHTYHKTCVGTKTDPMFKTYSQIVEDLHHSKTGVALLKIDIEGYEWGVFTELRSSTPYLPQQISAELHFWDPVYNQPWKEHPVMARTAPHAALLFFHLANLGYGVMFRENNPTCPACAEITFLRVEFPAGRPQTV